MRRCKAALFGAASLSCGVGRALSAPAATPPPACDSSGRKKCVVVGAGVVGLSTAYFLWKSGQYEIQVIEQRDACAQGASFQNGGVINVEAMHPISASLSISGTITDALMSRLSSRVVNTDITIQTVWEELRLYWLQVLWGSPNMLEWLWYFLQQRTPAQFEHTSRSMLALGRETRVLFPRVMDQLELDPSAHNFNPIPGFCLSKCKEGQSPAEYVHERCEKDKWLKVKTFVIGEELEECKRASGLVGIEDFDVGCIEPDNMTINTHSFCSSLQSFLEERGVKFHFGTTITRVMTDPDSDAAYPVIKAVCGVQLHTGVELPADDVVLCAGYETVHLLRTLGQKLALAPVKAYSLHIANPKLAAKEIHYATHLVSKSGAACLVTPYLNDPTGPGVRVTGIRDLDGFNGIHRPERVAVMVGCAQQVLGETSFDPEKDTQIWSGVMGVSPDDLPIVGPVKRFDGLWVNSGHGFRGTNHSLITADCIAKLMCKEDSSVASSLTPSRFGL